MRSDVCCSKLPADLELSTIGVVRIDGSLDLLHTARDMLPPMQLSEGRLRGSRIGGPEFGSYPSRAKLSLITSR